MEECCFRHAGSLFSDQFKVTKPTRKIIKSLNQKEKSAA
jgi:hypothetical protein